MSETNAVKDEPGAGEAGANLSDLLYSHPHGWVPLCDIEDFLICRGVSISRLERHNKTDGEYHSKFCFGENTLILNANMWSSESFNPLIEWFRGI